MVQFYEGVHYAIEGDCWRWIRACDSHGYGTWRDTDLRQVGAHRLAWEASHGAIPVGLHIDHLCRNRACVRVAHLELVTPAENARRGATPKVGWDAVRAIRESSASGRSLAAQYGLNEASVSRIRSRKAWWPEPCRR